MGNDLYSQSKGVQSVDTKVATRSHGESRAARPVSPSPSISDQHSETVSDAIVETGDQIWERKLAETPDYILDKMITDVESDIAQKKIRPVERTNPA